MKRFPLCLVAILASMFVLPILQAAEPETISLWDASKAPDGKDGFTDEEATIFIHRPEKPNGTAIIICPGGGYGGLVMGGEGHGIAKWLNEHGITGVVLKYRLPAGRSYVPLLDAQRAIRLVRSMANEWQIDPEKIGIAGFSAGGHLASTAVTHFDKESRPDFAILVYPVITMSEFTHGGSRNRLLGKNPTPEMVKLFSNELQVTDETPPVFLAHAKDDSVVPIANSQMFYDAMLEHKVSSEFLELPSGNHGLNGYKGPMWDAWQARALKWLAEQKFVTE